MPRLILTHKATGKKTPIELGKESLLIGRLATADIVIDLPTISRRHAEISRIGQDYFVTDLGSGNGTLLNGKKIRPQEKNLLKHDDLIGVEDYTLLFENVVEVEDFNPTGEFTDPGFMEIRMLKKVLGALDADSLPSLEGLTEPIEGKRVVFSDTIPELIVGREANCDFAIDTGAISRRHAVLRKKWGGITVADLGSKNATFVNDVLVTDEKILHDGDVIRFGNISVVFHNPQEVSLDDLGRELEEKQKADEAAQNPPEPEPAATENSNQESAISDQAKFSLGGMDGDNQVGTNPSDKKTEDAEAKPPEGIPEKKPAEEFIKPPVIEEKSVTSNIKKSRFSFLEVLLLLLGGAVFAAALIALVYLFL